MTSSTASNIALQAPYLSPGTQSQVRRSKYLEAALAEMQKRGEEPIRGWGELAAKLAATAILERGRRKTEGRAMAGAEVDRAAAADAMVAALTGVPGATMPRSEPSPAPDGAPQTPTATPLALGSNAAPAPADTGGGGYKRMAEALMKFLPGSRVTSGLRTPEKNAKVDGVPNSYHLKGEAIDFVPPPGTDRGGLRKALAGLGMPMTEFLDEGDHIHWASSGSGARPPQPPVNYAAISQPPPPAQSPPAAAGAPPAVASSAVGGNPLRATPEEIALVQRLASRPETFAQAQEMAMQLQARAAAPPKLDVQMVNGVPVRINPYGNGAAEAVALPQGLRTHTMTAQEAGIPAAPGTTYQQDPSGNLRQVYSPPDGYGVQGQGLAPIQGGPKDPLALQPPQPGMQYGPGGAQQPVAGLRRQLLTPAEVQAAGLPPGTVAQREPDGSTKIIEQITDGSRRTANLAYRAYQGAEQLNRLAEGGMYRPTPQLEWVDPILGFGEGQFRVRNAQDRQFVQASKEYLAPLLRKDTGAAVTDSELREYMDIYIPRSGDDPATLWQKARARADALQALINEAGPSFEAQYGSPQVRSLTDPRGRGASTAQRQPPAVTAGTREAAIKAARERGILQ